MQKLSVGETGEGEKGWGGEEPQGQEEWIESATGNGDWIHQILLPIPDLADKGGGAGVEEE